MQSITNRLAKIGAAAVTLLPTVVFAQGLTAAPEFQGTASGPLETSLIRVVNFFLLLAAIVAAIMIVYGGVQYITAGASSDSDQADKAKSTVIYAIIGLIVIGLSAAIANFVIRAINAA